MNHNKDNTRRRPKEVSDKHFQSEWDRIFGKNKSICEKEFKSGVLEVDPEMKEKIDKRY